MLLEPLSSTEQALRDTLVHKAAGAWLRRLGRMHGMPFPGGTEQAWRKAMHAAALGPRGTPGCTFDFVDGALCANIEEIDVTIDPAQPTRLTAVTPGSWEQRHVTCWVRVLGAVYRIEGPQDIVATSSGDWVELTPVATAYWKAAEFSGLASVTAATAEVLPFVVHEPSPGPAPNDGGEAGLYRVVTRVSTSAPATYIQPDASARPVGQPFGGQVQENEFEQGAPLGGGPHPLYLGGGGVFGRIAEVLDALLASGVRGEMKAEP